jgi:DNA polymerase-3 subunit epsilon
MWRLQAFGVRIGRGDKVVREVAFDTETTGLDPKSGDRIVELGCVEMINRMPTGREFQIYVNPGRPVSEATVRITGITNEILRNRPPFSHPDVVDRLMDFLGTDPIVAHNAEFDRMFLNAELCLLGRSEVPKDRFIDTLVLARQHRPGSPASLDAVCKRFGVSIEGRELHGALKDARLLSMVYLELTGGREHAFEFSYHVRPDQERAPSERRAQRRSKNRSRLTSDEAKAHQRFIEGVIPDAIWLSDYAVDQ